MDANGRLKLSVSLLQDFERRSDDELVLFCLPEGGLGLYPAAVWAAMRRQDVDPVEAGRSMLSRRTMRRFGGFSQRLELTRQGRITIPNAFREHADLPPGSEVVVVGAEIGVEFWSESRWNNELRLIQEHMVQKGQQELAADLSSGLCQGEEKADC